MATAIILEELTDDDIFEAYSSDEISDFCIENITPVDALEVVLASEINIFDESPTIQISDLVTVLSESNLQDVSHLLANDNPAIATELLDHLLYWRDTTKRI